MVSGIITEARGFSVPTADRALIIPETAETTEMVEMGEIPEVYSRGSWRPESVTFCELRWG